MREKTLSKWIMKREKRQDNNENPFFHLIRLFGASIMNGSLNA
jgi:hypothetical protein